MSASKIKSGFECRPIRKQYLHIWIDFYELIWWEKLTFKVDYSLRANFLQFVSCMYVLLIQLKNLKFPNQFCIKPIVVVKTSRIFCLANNVPTLVCTKYMFLWPQCCPIAVTGKTLCSVHISYFHLFDDASPVGLDIQNINKSVRFLRDFKFFSDQ